MNEALYEAVHSLEWQDQGSRKIVFLVGDAPPHMDYQNPKYHEVVGNARGDGIIVNTVLAGRDQTTAQIWEEIASIGGGEFVQIPQDGGQIVHIPSPFDQDIIEIQKQLDDTVVPYGEASLQAEVHSKLSGKTAASEDVAVANSKFYSKRSSAREVITGGGDLIGDYVNKRVQLDDIEKGHLPKDLQDKSQAEIEAYVKDVSNTRASLEKEMADLVSQRDTYVDAERKKTEGEASGDSFDKAVSTILQDQLK